MAVTRSSDGTSRPRQFPELAATAPTKKRVTKKEAPTTTAKAKKAAADVTKKAKATATKAKKEAEKKVNGTKANTSKPRAKKETKEKAPAKEKVTSGRVEKKTTTPKKKKEAGVKKRDTTLLEKAAGAVEYGVGVVQGKPGKKVCLHFTSLPFFVALGKGLCSGMIVANIWIVLGCWHKEDERHRWQGHKTRWEGLGS